MTPAVELMDALRARGVVIQVAGDRLRYFPRDAVSPEERAQLAAHKSALLAILSIAAESERLRSRYTHLWPDALPGLGTRRVGPYDPCGACSKEWTWARYGATALCLACARVQEGLTFPSAEGER